MTFKVGNTLFIAEQAPATCEACGKLDELRPYGKNGANVCFDCAMQDPATAARMFDKRLRGDS